jgi:hypothetical protein
MKHSSWSILCIRAPKGTVFEVAYRVRGVEFIYGYCLGLEVLEATPPQILLVGAFKRCSEVSIDSEWAGPAEMSFDLKRHTLNVQRVASWMKSYFSSN